MPRPRSAIAAVAALLALGALAAGCGEKPEPNPSAPPPPSAALDEAMQAVVDAGVPGVSVVIDRDPAGCTGDCEPVLARSAGGPALGSDAGIPPTATLRVASVTKAFEGAVVLALLERGKLRLRDTIAAHLGDAVSGARRITIAELMRHTSGLPDYTKDPAFLEAFTNGERITPRQAVAYVADEPLDFPPGSDYAYSDTDNLVLAEIVAEATGAPFATALRRLVLGPLGLARTRLATAADSPLPQVAGYQFDPRQPGGPADVTAALDPLAAGASGALVSSAGDVAAFFRGLRSGQLFDPALLARADVTVPGDSSPPGPPGVGTNASGLSIFRYDLSCGTAWGHTGTFPGYRAFGGATADGSAGFAVLVNASDLPPEADAALLELQELTACAALGG